MHVRLAAFFINEQNRMESSEPPRKVTLTLCTRWSRLEQTRTRKTRYAYCTPLVCMGIFCHQLSHVVSHIRLVVCTFQDGWTALMKAAQCNQSGAVRALLSAGSNKDLQNKVCTALHVCIFSARCLYRLARLYFSTLLCIFIEHANIAGRVDCSLHCRSQRSC